MEKKLDDALNAVEMTYSNLVQIANDMTCSFFEPINEIINLLNDKINSLSTDAVREYMLQLQLKAFSISEIKEKSALKAELAEALYKEKFAENFTGADGSAAVKDKLAQLSTCNEIVVETLYTLVANLFKAKLDQCHRLVDCLKSILMSRMQETKFMNAGTDDSVSATVGKKYQGNQF